MELGQIINHNITITPSANKGFIVKVGCGQFVYPNADELLKALKEYFKDPEAIEKQYNDKCVSLEVAAPTDGAINGGG